MLISSTGFSFIPAIVVLSTRTYISSFAVVFSLQIGMKENRFMLTVSSYTVTDELFMKTYFAEWRRSSCTSF